MCWLSLCIIVSASSDLWTMRNTKPRFSASLCIYLCWKHNNDNALGIKFLKTSPTKSMKSCVHYIALYSSSCKRVEWIYTLWYWIHIISVMVMDIWYLTFDIGSHVTSCLREYATDSQWRTIRIKWHIQDFIKRPYFVRTLMRLQRGQTMV